MMMTPVAMLLRRPRDSPMMEVVTAPRKQPTGVGNNKSEQTIPPLMHG